MKLAELIGLDWLVSQLPPGVTRRPRLTVTVVDGITHISDGITTVATTSALRARLYKHGIARRVARLQAAYQIKPGLVRAGDSVINFGANIGELVMGFSKIGARSLAIEPDPLTARCFALNHKSSPGVELLTCGLWDRADTLTFYQAPATADTSAINQVGAPLAIKVFPLDTIMEGRDPSPIRLLIGDAEGAEPEVLSGAKSTLERTEYVAIDTGYERNGERTTEMCSDILADSGFNILNIDKYNHLLAVNRRTLPK